MNDIIRIPGPEHDPDRDPDRDPGGEPGRKRHEQRLRMLEQLAGVGMNMARALMDRVEGRNGAPPAPVTMELVDSFVRLSHSVRQCVALSSRLEADWQAPRRPAAPRAALPGGWPDRRQREQDRAWVRNVVERSILAVADPRRRESLFLDMADLLDAAESGMKGDDRAPDEIVEDICGELGITPDPTLLAGTATGWDKPALGPAGPQFLPAPRRLH